jgi:putative transposase
MAKNSIPQSVFTTLLESVRVSEDIDVLRETAEWALQQLIEADVTEKVCAGRYEHTEDRQNHRNGYRLRKLKTRIGDLELSIPKLRKGSYFPEWLLERRKPAEQALLSVIMEAYANGVSTRKVERLVSEMGLDHLDKSTVSRISKGLDQRVKEFTERPIKDEYPFIWVDATYTKVREDGKVQSAALVVCMGVRKDGHREILGISLGSAETEEFWLEFLRTLKERGLKGVKLVTSDAHVGLTNAIRQVFTNVIWQRCQVHFMRNILSHVPRSAQNEVTNLVKSIFTQPSYEDAREQAEKVIERLSKRFSKAATILEEALDDLLAHMHFPKVCWKRLRSTNPLERLNREIKRRFNTVGIFPNREAVIRLAGVLLLEQQEEWIANNRRYFSDKHMSLLYELEEQEAKENKVA